MAQSIFVNLPVKDVEKSTAFYTGLGFEKNAQFSDENVSSIVISDTIVFMVMSQEFFKTFTTRQIADPSTHAQALFALSRDSREAVDEIADKALATGGAEANPAQDHGFMYGRSFADPDGHIIEAVWMDPSAIEG